MNPAPVIPSGVLPLEAGDPRHLGPYRLLGRLGAGGMGVVYAGLDDRDRRVAVKSVHRVLASDAEFVARFAREIGLVRRVRAACVPAFLGADTKAEVPWLATEYVPGPTLGKHVRSHGPLRGDALTAYALGIAEALAAIHAQGVVHRDLKPGNVILAPDGPKVLDFGIARATDGTALTHTGGMLGTPGWISPEQYRGHDATDRSDVFAWAGLVAYAATGQGAFGRGTSDVLVPRILSEPPSLDGVPEHLRGVLERALDKDPSRRPAAAELQVITAGLLGSHTREDVTLVMKRAWSPGTPPAAAPAPAEEWSRYAPPRRSLLRRHRTPLVVGAAVLAVALTAVLGARALTEGGSLPGEGTPGTEGQGEGSGATVAGIPEDAPPEYHELYETGEVAIEPASDTEPVLLRTLRPTSGDGEALEQLRMTFEGLTVREFGQAAVTIGAEYLPDHGGLRVHNNEFATVRTIQPDHENLRFASVQSSGVLAELSPEEPTAEFTVVMSLSPGDGALLYYVPDPLRGQEWNTFDYPGGFCVIEADGPTFPGSDDFGPHDTTLTGGLPTNSCAYGGAPDDF